MFYDEDDLDAILDTDEFAITVTYLPYNGQQTIINVIFQNEGEKFERDRVLIEVTQPQITCKESDIPNAGSKDQWIINGTTYRYSQHKPTNTGIATVVLVKNG